MSADEENQVSAVLQSQIENLSHDLYNLKIAVQGSADWRLPSLSDRITNTENTLLERIRSIEKQVSSLQEVQDAWIAEEKRKKATQEKREKLRNIILTSVLSFFGTTLAGIIVLLFKILNQGISP